MDALAAILTYIVLGVIVVIAAWCCLVICGVLFGKRRNYW